MVEVVKKNLKVYERLYFFVFSAVVCLGLCSQRLSE